MPDVRVHIKGSEDVSQATRKAGEGLRDFRENVQKSTKPLQDFSRSVRDILTGAGIAVVVNQVGRAVSDIVRLLASADKELAGSLDAAKAAIKGLGVEALSPLAGTIRTISDAIAAMGSQAKYAADQMARIEEVQKAFAAGQTWQDIVTAPMRAEINKIQAALFVARDALAKNPLAGVLIPEGITLKPGFSAGKYASASHFYERKAQLEAEIAAVEHYVQPAPGKAYNMASLLLPALKTADIDAAMKDMVGGLQLAAVEAIKRESAERALSMSFYAPGAWEGLSAITGYGETPGATPIVFPETYTDSGRRAWERPGEREDYATQKTLNLITGALEPFGEALKEILNPMSVLSNLLNRAIGPALSVLEPAISRMIQPLSVMFTVIASKLAPVLEWLSPAFKVLGDIIGWLYEHVIMPFGNAIIGIVNLLYNLGVVIKNIVTFNWKNLLAGTRPIDAGYLTPISGSDIGAAEAAVTSSYSSQTTVQPPAPVYIYFTIEGNVIGAASKEELGTWFVDCIQRALGTGVRPEFLVGAA